MTDKNNVQFPEEKEGLGFTVRSSGVEIYIGIILIAIMTYYLSKMYGFYREGIMSPVVLALMIVFCVIILLSLVITAFHSIEVAGKNITVKGLLRKSSFTCADITRINCVERRGYRGRVNYFIELFTDDPGKMSASASAGNDGFEKLADYLLVQLEKGMIKESAASPECKEELKRYKKGGLYDRVKRY